MKTYKNTIISYSYSYPNVKLNIDYSFFYEQYIQYYNIIQINLSDLYYEILDIYNLLNHYTIHSLAY